MTNEQILELAKTCEFDDFTGEKENFWECWEEQLLKFAQAIHENGYKEGYDEGYESSTMSSKMNTWDEE
jgi:flagellar biosynthesis/type III secretory pathway protein FliH